MLYWSSAKSSELGAGPGTRVVLVDTPSFEACIQSSVALGTEHGVGWDNFLPNSSCGGMTKSTALLLELISRTGLGYLAYSVYGSNLSVSVQTLCKIPRSQDGRKQYQVCSGE